MNGVDLSAKLEAAQQATDTLLQRSLKSRLRLCQKAGCASFAPVETTDMARSYSARLCDECREEWDVACEALPEFALLQYWIRFTHATEIALNTRGPEVIPQLEAVYRQSEEVRLAMRRAAICWLKTPVQAGGE